MRHWNFTTAYTAVYRNDITSYAAECGNLQPHMRRNAEGHHYTCGSMRTYTTAYAA